MKAMDIELKQRTDILLRSGNYFDYLAPERSIIEISDIGYGLARASRFVGQTFDPYSVAEHSVEVSYLVPGRFAYDALMHDMVEAIMGDMPTPLKQLLPEYKRIETGIEIVLFPRFGVSYPMPEVVKVADRVMLSTERRDLMPQKDDVWTSTQGVQPLAKKLVPLADQAEAFRLFMNRYLELRPA